MFWQSYLYCTGTVPVNHLFALLKVGTLQDKISCYTRTYKFIVKFLFFYFPTLLIEKSLVLG
jgi:hypothetical protein